MRAQLQDADSVSDTGSLTSICPERMEKVPLSLVPLARYPRSVLSVSRVREVYSIAASKRNRRALCLVRRRKWWRRRKNCLKQVKLYRDAIELPSRGSVYRVLSCGGVTAKEGLNASSSCHRG
jgi:hypothetical protein